ncbi:MAG: diaminopimelate epimerase [Solirubrobacterales bacterium]|nr:diaminopimelate epimerase [Solirubrobacterales bacterium]
MRFEKWQALGNDYVIVEAAALPWELTPERIRLLCRPHLAIGSDGILLLVPIEDPAYVAELRIFNPDGSEAELSGNGAREAALYLRRSGWTDEDEFTILTKAGAITPRISSERICELAMGRASTESADYPAGDAEGRGELQSGGRSWGFQHVSIGNPQCAIEAGDELEELDLAAIGPGIESGAVFPNRTNVSFYRVESPPAAGGSRLRARIFERGVGETLSSGTGASGAAVAAFLGGAPSPVTVELDGGELEVGIAEDLAVTLTGWAEPVYAGELSAEMVRRIEGE